MTGPFLSIPAPDGRRIAYAEWGDPQGIPVMYCHGFPGSRLEARLADAAAGDLGIRLIAADRPGFGGSTLQSDRRFHDWPNDLAVLADALSISRFHLIGVSGGAPYAIAGGLALDQRVIRIALVCGLGEYIGENATAGMNPAAATAIKLQRHWPRLGQLAYLRLVGPLLGRFPELVFKVIVGNATGADRDVLDDTWVHGSIVSSFAEAFRQGAAGPAHEVDLITRPWVIDPADLRVPVRLWHGEADRTVPVAMGRRHASLIPDVIAHFVPGEGHFSLIVRYMHQILADLIRHDDATA